MDECLSRQTEVVYLGVRVRVRVRAERKEGTIMYEAPLVTEVWDKVG